MHHSGDLSSCVDNIFSAEVVNKKKKNLKFSSFQFLHVKIGAYKWCKFQSNVYRLSILRPTLKN